MATIEGINMRVDLLVPPPIASTCVCLCISSISAGAMLASVRRVQSLHAVYLQSLLEAGGAVVHQRRGVHGEGGVYAQVESKHRRRGRGGGGGGSGCGEEERGRGGYIAAVHVLDEVVCIPEQGLLRAREAEQVRASQRGEEGQLRGSSASSSSGISSGRRSDQRLNLDQCEALSYPALHGTSTGAATAHALLAQPRLVIVQKCEILLLPENRTALSHLLLSLSLLLLLLLPLLLWEARTLSAHVLGEEHRTDVFSRQHCCC